MNKPNISVSALLERIESEAQIADGRTVQLCRDPNGNYWVVDGAERVLPLRQFAAECRAAGREFAARERAEALRRHRSPREGGVRAPREGPPTDRHETRARAIAAQKKRPPRGGLSPDAKNAQLTCWIPASIQPAPPASGFCRFQISSNCCGAWPSSSRMRPENRMLAQCMPLSVTSSSRRGVQRHHVGVLPRAAALVDVALEVLVHLVGDELADAPDVAAIIRHLQREEALLRFAQEPVGVEIRRDLRRELALEARHRDPAAGLRRRRRGHRLVAEAGELHAAGRACARGFMNARATSDTTTTAASPSRTAIMTEPRWSPSSQARPRPAARPASAPIQGLIGFLAAAAPADWAGAACCAAGGVAGFSGRA